MVEFDMPMYGNTPRVTLDGEWTHEELSDNIDDECLKLVPGYAEKYKNRAVYDKNLFLPLYVAEKIKNESADLVDVYNSEYDKHRNEKLFGIYLFDKWIEEQVRCIMNDNLIGGK